MKVYAVTAGSYSDYHIVAITDDKEKADALVELINKQCDKYGNDDAYAEEYDTKDVDIAVTHPNRKYFCVRSYAYNNWIIRCGEISLDEYLQYRYQSCYVNDTCFNNYWTFYCSARSQDQAIKKATDWFAQEKARIEGVI
ncbi:MAG: hypothetical protein J6U54_16070 [Clostridiales bacterium]|nr:hypothetical protein [Clostridiales bacterium]